MPTGVSLSSSISIIVSQIRTRLANTTSSDELRCEEVSETIRDESLLLADYAYWRWAARVGLRRLLGSFDSSADLIGDDTLQALYKSSSSLSSSSVLANV